MAWGIGAAWELKRRARLLRIWVYALETMLVRCDCARETPMQIYLSGASHARVLERIAMAKSEEEISKILSDEGMPKDAYGLVLSALFAIWNGSRDEQLQGVRFSLRQLELLQNDAQRQCVQNVRLYMTLGILGGLSVGLMLL